MTTMLAPQHFTIPTYPITTSISDLLHIERHTSTVHDRFVVSCHHAARLFHAGASRKTAYITAHHYLYRCWSALQEL
jgi:hypothetical protein